MTSPARVSPQCSRHTPCAVAAFHLSCCGIQRLNRNQAERADGTRDPLAGAPPATLRRGLSLMELLIATTISIMLMAATVTLFGVVGDKVNAGRAMIETGDRLRATRNRLSADLRGATVSFVTWEQPSAASGCFEIVKGPAPNNRDANPNSTLVGYTQDVLMLTTRSRDVPFTGRFLNPSSGSLTTIESQVAEVTWYMQPTFNAQGQQQFIVDAQGNKSPLSTLYRRQFLVIPSPVPATPPTGTLHPLLWFYDNYDISAHPDGNGNMIANSLADLSYREFRFAHNNFSANRLAPFLVLAPPNPDPAVIASGTNYDSFADGLMPFQPPYSPNGSPNPVGSQRYGEDVALTNVLSFDVKVWDPGAEVRLDNSDPALPRSLVPSDPGYTGTKTVSYSPPQFGAYVDLNYTSTKVTGAGGNDSAPINNLTKFGNSFPPTYFAGPYYGSGLNSGLAAAKATVNFATFDSWSGGYEYYNSTMAATNYNKSNNGFDNDGSNGVNDPSERQTSPPYPVPLRGVQIKIRVYEPTSRQVREVTVTETFLPD